MSVNGQRVRSGCFYEITVKFIIFLLENFTRAPKRRPNDSHKANENATMNGEAYEIATEELHYIQIHHFPHKRGW